VYLIALDELIFVLYSGVHEKDLQIDQKHHWKKEDDNHVLTDASCPTSDSDEQNKKKQS
jgi:hypothetical protein